MTKIDKHIEIVSSSSASFSSMSRESREAIRAVLVRRYQTVGITIVDTPADLERLVARRPDLVFLGMKFIPRDARLGVNDPHKLWVSDYLDGHGITYTGSGALAVKLEASKQLAKQRVLDAGLASARYKIIRRTVPLALQAVPLTFPLFVKPSNRGGGFGIDSDSVVTSDGGLKAKLRYITATLGADALVEEYLPGREFSVAILKQAHAPLVAAMPIELIAEADSNGARILGRAVKSSNTERVMAVTNQQVRNIVCSLAEDVFEALGGRDYGRIDIRMDAQGVPHFLEANLYPSLVSGYGSFPKACLLNENLHFEDMILTIVELGLARGHDGIEELPTFFGELVTA
jgi:D-alanine-D-alanine ligase